MTIEELRIDAMDLALLRQLQQDATISNQALAARVHTSPATCLRRVKRLHDAGLIERQIAILNPDKLAALTGHGLTNRGRTALRRRVRRPRPVPAGRPGAEHRRAR